MIITGKGAGIGLDPDKMREALATRFAFTHEIEMLKRKEEALAAALRQASADSGDSKAPSLHLIDGSDYSATLHQPRKKKDCICSRSSSLS